MLTALLLVSVAQAASLGSTMALGTPAGLTGTVPSFDVRTPAFFLQLHALETLVLLSDESVLLGADAFFGRLVDRPLGGTWSALLQPGVGVDLLDEPFTLALVGEFRLAAETRTQPATVGLAVVPELGLLTGDVDPQLIAGGTVQFSVAFDVAK